MILENPSHEAFCQEYMLNGFNGTRAYMAVYPDTKETSAMSSASDLLRNPKVSERIAELRAEMTDKYGISIQEIVNSIKETRALAKSQSDFTNSLKSDDMLLKITGGYAVEKSKTDLQFLDKNGQPTEPPTTTIHKSYFTKKDVPTEN